ncbi:MAG: hypothetical protein L3J93_05000 [Thermoplasmata archaeon]|nr:hypothetical protein [Thermoplasmata archaeon]
MVGTNAVALGIVALLLFSGLGTVASPSTRLASSLKVAAAGGLSVTFSFSPNPVNSGSSTQYSVTISGIGATSPFYLWFNSTPQGCQSGSNPTTANSASYSGSCNPSSSGSFTVQLGVVDSNSTVQHHGSAMASLTVNSNGGNNNGGSGSKSGNNSNGSFNLLNGLGGVFSILILFAAVFLGALIAIAAGTIATAAVVSRRLRQINETLKQTIPPTQTKPPT